jgi:hypothetical protein
MTEEKVVADIVELVGFLQERLTEERTALANTSAGPWQWDGKSFHPPVVEGVAFSGLVGSGLLIQGGDAKHIARYNPSRILAEVEAKRQVVQDAYDYVLHGQVDRTDGMAERTLRLLALPYAWHDNYREEWAPEASDVNSSAV